ncbi:PREDICTED: protein FAM161B [Nanorana parkeri]|uniref:protein FAM161B n=1 Tax=Nanorana parkeri TaxID=125878 RepID=UPI000854DBD0|nr:PREDICTED: protein FAM161B [Nanorana parkeri]
MAGDDPGRGGRPDGQDGDLQFLDTLHSLKSRNGLYLQELAGLYEAGLGDGALDRFFFSTPLRDPNVALQSPEAHTRARARKSCNAVTFTVPEPFQMSVRERESPQAWADPDPDMKQEDIECYKQFRAQPVPAQVLLPLYNDIMEQQDERRKSDIQRRKEQLMAMQKPFHFLSEERKKSHERPVTAPAQKSPSVIKAIPKSVLDPSVSDRLKEAELLRKINSQLRAKELLQSSSAPVTLTRHSRDPNSRTSLKCKEQHLAFLQQNLTFQPRTNPAVPDFQELYKNFQRLSLSRQTVREPTETKPFNFLTSNQRHRKKPSRTEREQDEEQPRVPPSRHLSSLSPNTLPVYITDSTKRREASIRFSLQDQECKSAEREKWLQKHRQRSLAMQRSVSRRAKALDPHKPLADTNRHKLRENQVSDLKRSQEYQMELEQMKSRVRRRAFLFEQVWKGSAVKEAERRFTHTLRQAGLTEEFVQQKGNVDEEMADRYEHQDDEEP